MTTNRDHNFQIRILTENGELALEDVDFAENARWDLFEQHLREATRGETVQLINIEENRVLCEEMKGH